MVVFGQSCAWRTERKSMGVVNFFINLLEDPRTAIAGWISMGVAPTLGFIFLIIFVETGVVVFPFLPGDSLLFAAGFFAAPDAVTGEAALPLALLLPVVWLAPIIGDQCNYFIGHFFGNGFLLLFLFHADDRFLEVNLFKIAVIGNERCAVRGPIVFVYNHLFFLRGKDDSGKIGGLFAAGRVIGVFFLGL